MPFIDIRKIVQQKLPNKHVPEVAIRYLEKIVHVQQINDYFRRNPERVGFDFLKDAIENELGATVSVTGTENLTNLGNEPVTFVSNHPLGGLDGMIIAQQIGQYRGERLRVIVNDLLMALTPMKDIFAPVNKLGAQTREYAVQQRAIWDSDYDILSFPAGFCSRRQSWRGPIKDYAWKQTFIKQSLRTHRKIVPIYFEGENSRFFYNLSFWRMKLGLPNIEMLYLADEMYKARGKHFVVHFLPAVEPDGMSAADIQNIVYNYATNHRPSR